MALGVRVESGVRGGAVLPFRQALSVFFWDLLRWRLGIFGPSELGRFAFVMW